MDPANGDEISGACASESQQVGNNKLLPASKGSARYLELRSAPT